MHELSLAQHLLDLTLEGARQSGAHRVVGLHHVVGPLSPLEETSLSFYWEHVSQATPAAGSVVHVRRLPMTLMCTNCGRPFQLRGEVWACPGCGSETRPPSRRRRILSGSHRRRGRLPIAGAAMADRMVVGERILQANDDLADANRRHLDRAGVFSLTLMASPGAGKTSLIERTVRAMHDRFRLAVIDGDLATSLDADRTAAAGALRAV